MSTAEFTINYSSYANLGYDAQNGQSLSVKLETLSTDIRKVVFSLVSKSKDAPDLVFTPSSGEPASPGDAVQVDMPATGSHTYILRCQVNDGVDALASTVEAWTKERAVAIRTPSGRRKMVPVERTEYESPDGWTGAYNDLVGEDESDASGGTAKRVRQWFRAVVPGGAGPTTIWSYALPDPASAQVKVGVLGRDTADDVASYFYARSFKRAGGGTAGVGTVSTLHQGEDDAAWNLAVNPSGNNIILVATPDAVNETTFEGYVDMILM